MAQDIQNLIEKIRQEGIKAAEEKAREIEGCASKEAERIIARAKTEAERLIAEAKQNYAKMEEKQKTLLAQSGRDFLLALKREINALLNKVITAQAEKVLTTEEITRIIFGIIKDRVAHNGGIIISLKKDELQALEKHFFSQLRDELKRGISLKSSEDVRAGFIISYDAGKSQWDFSDKALADYIGSCLNPKLNAILQEAAAAKNKD